jgi:hypothetical protein
MKPAMKIVPPENTLAELERKAAEYEAKAIQEPEPEATRLREQAKVCRQWITALKSGGWIP